MANVLQIAGLAIILYNLLSNEWSQFPDQLPAVGDKIPQFFVSSLFIFEGISVVCSKNFKILPFDPITRYCCLL